FPGELQELHRDQEARRLTKSETADATHEDQRDRSEIDQLGFRCLLRAMSCSNMGDLMGHYASQLRFVVRSENQSTVDIEKPTGQSERVDLIGLHDFDRERNLRVRIPNEILSYTIDILVDGWIIEQLHLPLDFRRQLPAHRDFFIERNEID